MKTNYILWWFTTVFFTVLGMACMEKPVVKNPQGYDLTNPVKYFMTDALFEISGIAFKNGRSDSVYAVQDEKGNLYHLKLDNKKPAYAEFAGNGDYEDIAIMGEQVFVLRSDGTLFTFLYKQLRSKEILDVHKFDNLLPAGEYEGMYADVKARQLYILCKNCNDFDAKKLGKGYILQVTSNAIPKLAGEFIINVKDIEDQLGKKKLNFRPSALAKNEKTNEWYILSSVNKALIVTDAAWQVKAAFPLNSSFTQPEGIAFDNQNNLYISNEGDKLTSGTIFKFIFKK